MNRLEWKDISDILSSRHIDSDTDISVTGGEPFLHENILPIILSLYTEGFRLNTLSTNGTHEKQLLNLLSEMKKKRFPFPDIHISFDGNEKNHDLQRGVPWMFRVALKTIRSVQRKFPEVRIKIKCTITGKNIEDIPFLWHFSQKIGVSLWLKTIENDPSYTNRRFSPVLLSKNEKKGILGILKELYKDRDPYINKLSYFLRNDSTDFSCTTPETSLFVMADGKTHCCTKYGSIGNIKETRIDDMLFTGKHSEIISEARITDCRKCFSYHWSYKSLVWTI